MNPFGIFRRPPKEEIQTEPRTRLADEMARRAREYRQRIFDGVLTDLMRQIATEADGGFTQMLFKPGVVAEEIMTWLRKNGFEVNSYDSSTLRISW